MIIRLEKFRQGKINLDRLYWTNAAISKHFKVSPSMTHNSDIMLEVLAT